MTTATTPDDDGDPATLDLRVRILETVTAQPGLSRREINEALPDVEPRDISVRLQYMCTAARKHRLMRTGDEGRYRYWPVGYAVPPDAGKPPADNLVGIRNPESVQARVLRAIQAQPGITTGELHTRLPDVQRAPLATANGSLLKRGQVQVTGKRGSYRYWPVGYDFGGAAPTRATESRLGTPELANSKVRAVDTPPARATESRIGTRELANSKVPTVATPPAATPIFTEPLFAPDLDIDINAGGQVRIRDDLGDVVVLTPAQARAVWLFLDRTLRVLSPAALAMLPTTGERTT